MERIFPGVKQLGHEADCSSGAMVKNIHGAVHLLLNKSLWCGDELSTGTTLPLPNSDLLKLCT
jgi:hypothetical protein